MKPLISVIVPVYKVEPYLRKCVDSILDQTYQNLEVILVDDGSPDNCGAICDDYAAQDCRVKVIHKKNGGLSSARNAGLEIASGEYISFVDSDDILPQQSLELLLRTIEEQGAQIAIGENLRFSDVPQPEENTSLRIHCMSQSEAMQDVFKNGCASWARLYRRKIHDGVLFPDGEINEDEAIVLRLLEKCEKVVKTTAIVYYYRCRPESITTTSFHPRKLAWVRHCRENLTFIRERHPELERLALARYRGSILWSLTEMALSNDSFEDAVKELINELRENARVFRRVPFAFWQDRIRMHLLLIGPFALYRWFIRKKRGIR